MPEYTVEDVRHTVQDLLRLGDQLGASTRVARTLYTAAVMLGYAPQSLPGQHLPSPDFCAELLVLMRRANGHPNRYYTADAPSIAESMAQNAEEDALRLARTPTGPGYTGNPCHYCGRIRVYACMDGNEHCENANAFNQRTPMPKLRRFDCGHSVLNASSPFCAQCVHADLERFLHSEPERSTMRVVLEALEMCTGEDCLSAIGQRMLMERLYTAVDLLSVPAGNVFRTDYPPERM